jgi:hypothetical protein
MNRRLARLWSPKPQRLPRRRSPRPQVERLEDRLTPATTISVGPTTADLIAATDTADHTPGRPHPNGGCADGNA